MRVALPTRLGGGGDLNKDFVAYRHKIISILRDNGMRVNDVEGKSAAMSAKSARPSAFSDRESDIADAVISDPNKTDSMESIRNMRDDLFEQSFYISLIIGEALSVHFKAPAFYDIPVKVELWDQYFKVVKSGNKDVVYCFSPSFGEQYENGMFVVASVDFKSDGDYSYTFLQFDELLDTALYVHGNSDKQFYAVSVDSINANNNYIYYAPNDGEGWASDNAQSAHDCFEYVRDEFVGYSAAEFRALADCEYSLNERQYESISEKYFGDNGGPITMQGLQYVVIDGEKIAVNYIAEGEDKISFPADVRYVASEFYIVDNADNVKSLYIPATVVGVKRLESETSAIDVAASELRIRCSHATQGVTEPMILQSITVEQGSTLFKSGTGHLYTADGHIVYLADCAIPTLDRATVKSLVGTYKEGGFENYKNLFASLTSVNIVINEYYDEYEHGIDYDSVSVLGEAISRAARLNSISITSYKTNDEEKGGMVDLTVKLNGDIALKLDMSSRTFSVSVNFENASSAVRRVTATATKLPYNCQGYIQLYGNGNIAANIVVPYTEQYYREIYDKAIFTDFGNGGSCEMTFEGSFDPSAGLPQGMTLVRDIMQDGFAVRVDYAPDERVDVPDECNGEPVMEVQINADEITGKATVGIPDTVSRIVFLTQSETNEFINGKYLSSFFNSEFTFVYGGSYDSFRDITLFYDYANGYRFNAVCSDGEHVCESSTEPSQDFFEVRIDINGVVTTERVQAGWTLTYDPSQWNLQDDYIYYLIDDDGNDYMIYDCGDGYPEIRPQKPTTYRLVRVPRGEPVEDTGNYESEYAVLYNDITMTVRFIVRVFDNSAPELRIYVYGYDGNVRYSSDYGTLFHIFLIERIVDGEDGNSETQMFNVRFTTSIDENGTIRITEIIDVELPDDGKDDKDKK